MLLPVLSVTTGDQIENICGGAVAVEGTNETRRSGKGAGNDCRAAIPQNGTARSINCTTYERAVMTLANQTVSTKVLSMPDFGH